MAAHEEGGFYRGGSELLFRDVTPPMRSGMTIRMSDVKIEILHVTDDGIPDEASFELANDLEAGYVFLEWKGKAMVPFVLPGIGETVSFTRRRPELF